MYEIHFGKVQEGTMHFYKLDLVHDINLSPTLSQGVQKVCAKRVHAHFSVPKESEPGAASRGAAIVPLSGPTIGLSYRAPKAGHIKAGRSDVNFAGI